jgi:hypothetical protein
MFRYRIYIERRRIRGEIVPMGAQACAFFREGKREGGRKGGGGGGRRK